MVTPWLCFKCTIKTFPLGNNQNSHLFIHSNSGMNEFSVGKYSNGNSILTLLIQHQILSFNQFNELTTEPNMKSPVNFINCGNLDIDEIRKIKIEPNLLSLFHINSYYIYINLMNYLISLDKIFVFTN